MTTARRRRSKSKTLSKIRSSTMTLPELPKDLVEEILCRVPATSLNRLRSTCKAWNRLFKDDRRFAIKHLDRSAKQFLPIMLTKDHRVLPFSVNLRGSKSSVAFKRELKLFYRRSKFIDRVFHCDGLLLCTSEENDSRIVVWNPFTRETRWIEAGLKRRGFNFVLGYSQEDNNNSKSYKILSYYSGRNDSEIYDFESDSWRVLGYDITQGWNLAFFSYCHRVSLKGNIYQFARDKSGIESLLRFDFTTEKYQPVHLPYQCDSYAATILSVVREEKLSVLLQRREDGSKTEIWVTNKIHDTTNTVTWIKVLALDLSRYNQITGLGSFLLDEEKKVVQICQRWFDKGDDGSYNNDMLFVVGEHKKVVEIVVYDVDDITSMLASYSSLRSKFSSSQASWRQKEKKLTE